MSIAGQGRARCNGALMHSATISAFAPTRREDLRLITGHGFYVHDIALPGMLHAVFVRSEHARGRIVGVGTKAARAFAGVRAVLVAQDVTGLSMPAVNPMLPASGTSPAPLLADGQVCAVGQAIALVVADSRAGAMAAAELVELEIAEACAPDGKGDEVFRVAFKHGEPGIARHRVEVRHAQPRVAPAAMETRATVATRDGNHLTVWLPTQSPARARDDIAATLGLTKSQVRVIAPDVGGAFGGKATVCPEDLLVAVAAWQLNTAVKWSASRSEDFMSATQGRGAQLHGTLALDDAGRFTHLQARLRFPLGAWLPYSAAMPLRNAARILPGPYRLGSIDIEATADTANAAAVNIYRGAGRPEAALLMERLVDAAARVAGVDPLELRRRNLVSSSAMPYTTPTGERFDSGDYHAALDRAAARFGYLAERQQQLQRRASGELVGIGIAMYVEPCGQGFESARVTLLPDGTVHLASGSAAQGQGHETTFAEIAAEALGCTAAQVSVVHGDTNTAPDGIGALASRSIAIGGSAILEAARAAARRRDAGVALPLTAESIYRAPGEAWSYGCVMVRLAIDGETGKPAIERLVWVDDAGRVISPQLAEGQLVGGLAQGIGQALMECIVYDDHGQLLTGSLMDYALPRAADMPVVELESLAIPATANLLGAKGVGEAGTIGVPAAILNAAIDALAPLGVTELDFPLTAERLWRTIHASHKEQAA
jgi:carbon-monoxide dehydrogenase large subunit